MGNKIIKTKMHTFIDVEIAFLEEDKYIVAYCPALELSAYGSTIDEAKSAFEIELEIFLEETFKRGTLEKYLLKNGWRLQQQPELNYEPPRRKLEFGKGHPTFITHQIAIPV